MKKSFDTSHLLTDDNNPALYVSTYHKYNCGSLSGAWVDLSSFLDFDDFMEFCRELHADEADPEFMFQDYMNFPEEFYSESGFSESDFEHIQEYADFEDKEAYHAYCNIFGNFNERDFYNRFQGKYNSEEDFARQMIDDCYNLDNMEHLIYYFDYAAYTRDLFMYDYSYEDGYVFSHY